MYHSSFPFPNHSHLHPRVQAAEEKGRDQGARLRELTDIVQHQQARMDSLALTCRALYELLQERVGITNEELQARVHEVDERDGVRDGRMNRPPTPCASCSRPVSERHSHCIYCGTLAEGRDEPFING